MITMKDSVEKSNKEIINSILLKMYEQKSEFINDIKLIIDKSDNDKKNIKQLSTAICKNINILWEILIEIG